LEPRRAVEELRNLRAQADTPDVRLNGPEHKSWKAKVVAVMENSLGRDSATLRQFTELRYSIGIWSGAPGEAQRDAEYFAKRVRDAAGLLDAAIYELELQCESDQGDDMGIRNPASTNLCAY
jgi:hypothetical protein